MYSFKELRNATKMKMDGKEMRLAVLGNCSTQFLSTAILGYSKLSELNVNVYDADFNQIEAQLLDKTSEVYSFNPDYILIWLATERLYEDFLNMPLSERINFAEGIIERLQLYWKLVRKNSSAKVLQVNFTEIDDKVLGQFSAKVDSTFIFQIRKLNWLLQEAMSKNINVYPIDLLSIQIKLGQKEFYDAAFYYRAKMSVSTKALPYFGKAVVDVLLSMSGKIKKCIVLDLDNTLWGGIIGDDGINKIEIGELGRGPAFTNLQRWLKQLKEYGIILAVCSKNNESIAKEPFEKHDEMVLRLDDIAIFVANWNDKVTNIKLIQESLNIGMDSMVFLDDNPFERNLVREMIPDIEVPELPEDPADYLEFLQNCNYFETVSYVGEGADRTNLYQAEFERKRFETQFTSIGDYLSNLGMIGEAKPFEESKYSRIAQLTQRSNQFNLRTIRYTEAEIQNIAENSDYITQYYTLKDKFGDHGLVGVVILKKVDNETLFIDTWIMSCRVIKRTMEEFIINKIIETARINGFKYVTAEYIPTAKNRMAEKIYDEMGFSSIGDNRYSIAVEMYKNKETFIREK